MVSAAPFFLENTHSGTVFSTAATTVPVQTDGRDGSGVWRWERSKGTML